MKFFLWVFLLLPFTIHSQVFMRLQADYSIKIKNADSTSSLNMGTLYYDLSQDKIVYENKFPVTEIWITKDTLIYRIVGGKLVRRVKTLNINKLTVFYLALSGRLENFGLPEAGFSIKKVEKQGDLVITEWLPPEAYRQLFGSIYVSHQNGHIDAVIMKDKDGKLVSRQFFRKFVLVQGLSFPTKVVLITYTSSGEENYQLTNYKNIRLNDYSQNTMYDYPVR